MRKSRQYGGVEVEESGQARGDEDLVLRGLFVSRSLSMAASSSEGHGLGALTPVNFPERLPE
jgi:hypothetical protein